MPFPEKLYPKIVAYLPLLCTYLLSSGFTHSAFMRLSEGQFYPQNSKITVSDTTMFGNKGNS